MVSRQFCLHVEKDGICMWSLKTEHERYTGKGSTAQTAQRNWIRYENIKVAYKNEFLWLWPIRNLFSNTVSWHDKHVFCL